MALQVGRSCWSPCVWIRTLRFQGLSYVPGTTRPGQGASSLSHSSHGGCAKGVKDEPLSARVWPKHRRAWEGEWGRAAVPTRAQVPVGRYSDVTPSALRLGMTEGRPE